MRSHAHKKNADKKSPRGSASARASKTANPVAGKTGNRLLGRVAQQLAAEATETKHGHRGGAAAASAATPDRLLSQAARKKHLRQNRTRRASLKPAANGEMFRSLLDSLNTGVAHVTAKGEILYANERFGELLGLETRKDLTGTPLNSYVSSANWSLLDTALRRACHGPVEGESQVSRPGSKKILRMSFAPMPNTKPPTIRVAATEVTQLLEATKALKQSEASLHELSRELVKIQDQERRSMARNLHDVTGQELAVAVVSLDRLARNLDAPKADVQANLEECAGWIRKVEGEVRTLSYMLHPPLLDEMGLGMALDVFTKGFTKRTGIEINLQVAANLPRLPQEKEVGMFRVIQECLSNVLRHSGSQRAWVRVGLQNGTFRVSVRDEGKGIQTKRNGTSLPQGVGMQSMKGRLRIMDGALEVKSDRHGTEVIATAPLERDEILATDNSANAELSMADLDAAQTQNGGRKRVLIVDDHEVARQGIKALLKDEPDLEICGEAEDGLQAIERAKELRPDLIIMDLTMPHVGGFSAANRIRETHIPTRIIIYTTHSYPELERMAHAVGCHGFVLKSNASKDLLRGARAVLRGDEFYSSVANAAHN